MECRILLSIFLTFDDHYEVYTKRLDTVPLNQLEKMQSRDGLYNAELLRSILANQGIQLLGRLTEDPDLQKNEFIHCNGMSSQDVFRLTDRIVYFSVLNKNFNEF